MPEEYAAASPEDPALSPRVALLSMVGFWAFYCAIVTLRSAVIGQGVQPDVLVRRLALMLFSIGLTYLVYLVLRRIRSSAA